MNQKKALALAKGIYPELHPKIPTAFLVEDGVLIITIDGSKDVLVVHNEIDLSRLIRTAKTALDSTDPLFDNNVLFSIDDDSDSEDTLDFLCGWEDNGYISDQHNHKNDEKVKSILINAGILEEDIDVGAAESYHMVYLNKGYSTKEEAWEIIKKALIKAGAKEKL